MDGDGADAERAAADPWALPRWIDVTAKSLRGLLNAAGVVVAMICCMFALDPLLGERYLLLSMIAVFPLITCAVALHEGGHLFAARRAGMTVVQAHVGWMVLIARRRGWQLSWRRPMLRVGGLLVAYPDPDRPLRPQYALMTWGGPLANLLAAAACGALAAAVDGTPHWLLLAFAATNASLGVANLMPVLTPLPSDGMQLLALRDPSVERHPHYRFQRVLGMCLRGMTADRLPATDLDAIGAMEAPLPLVAEWLRMKAAQQRAEWAQAVAIGTDAEGVADTLPPAQRASVATLLSLLRAEVAFSRALLTRDPTGIAEPALTAGVEASAPHFAPRLRALHAALTGNATAREYWLGLSEPLAEESIDRSLAVSEARLRDAIRAIS